MVNTGLERNPQARGDVRFRTSAGRAAGYKAARDGCPIRKAVSPRRDGRHLFAAREIEYEHRERLA
jgi:hypothetical protein